MSSQTKMPAEQRPTWGQWLLSGGLALAGGVLAVWAPSSWLNLPFPDGVPLYMGIVAGVALVGGAILNSWWALAAMPVAAMIGMALSYLNVPAEVYWVTVVGGVMLGLPSALVGAGLGVRLRQYMASRQQRP
jgi:hypothetical protein